MAKTLTSNLLNISKGVWNHEKDLCRCCHSEGSFKNLYTSYLRLDIEEVYFNMLQECLDIELVAVAEHARMCTICDTCIRRLRDTAQFKHQVQKCETLFRNYFTNENTSVHAGKKLKRTCKAVLSKLKGKRKRHPRKHTVFLKSNEAEIDYSNQDVREIAVVNRSIEEISYRNKEINIGDSDVNKGETENDSQDMAQIVYGNRCMEEIYKNKNIEFYSNKSKKEISHKKMSTKEVNSVLRNNAKDENNDDYDSDTPISRLSKIYTDSEDKLIEKINLNKQYESTNFVCKAPQYTSKPVSERKRIRVTCETVLRHTTACPFRHHTSWFRCFYCARDFMDIVKLRQHTLQSHSEEDVASIKRYPRTLQIEISDFRCKICTENLTDVQDMVGHLLKVHNKMAYKECIADYKVNTSPYTCHICRKQYHVFRTLTTHLNEHYANCICDVCGKPYLNTKRLKVHKRTHESGNFPCTECGKVLKTKTAKANHMESHSKRILKCHLCSKPMKHYNDRIKHMSEVHNITHKFKCVICGREYNIKQYLATHMRQTHGHKHKQCLECGMAFMTNYGLKKHMVKHSGEKAFPCTICSKAYARSYTLKEHMRGHVIQKVD